MERDAAKPVMVDEMKKDSVESRDKDAVLWSLDGDDFGAGATRLTAASAFSVEDDKTFDAFIGGKMEEPFIASASESATEGRDSVNRSMLLKLDIEANIIRRLEREYEDERKILSSYEEHLKELKLSASHMTSDVEELEKQYQAKRAELDAIRITESELVALLFYNRRRYEAKMLALNKAEERHRRTLKETRRIMTAAAAAAAKPANENGQDRCGLSKSANRSVEALSGSFLSAESKRDGTSFRRNEAVGRDEDGDAVRAFVDRSQREYDYRSSRPLVNDGKSQRVDDYGTRRPLADDERSHREDDYRSKRHFVDEERSRKDDDYRSKRHLVESQRQESYRSKRPLVDDVVRSQREESYKPKRTEAQNSDRLDRHILRDLDAETDTRKRTIHSGGP
ncbi:hypothetical protein HDU67_001795 [Dinochytrium kinnereticum]|nr:hypothetical protein HDU67_001795 [Dinochytrium kinnereticum]